MIACSRILLLASACFLALVSRFAAPALAQPQVKSDPAAACMQEGVLAEKLALARDNGMSMLEAIDAVLVEDRSARREQVAAHATLLFKRFRRLSAEQAAFEFRLACLDDAQ